MSNEPIPYKDAWTSAAAYEPYVGRWSRLVAREFVQWLGIPPGKRWLDIGCGTGVLSEAVLRDAAPAQIRGIDRSASYIAYVQHHIQDERASFATGDAQALPVDDAAYDVAVSGLVLNFVAQPDRAVAEMARAVTPDGVVALYVWDYAGKMQMMRHFWNAAAALDPKAYDLDEGRRSPICNPDVLTDVFWNAHLSDIEVRAIDVATDFKDFDDYWTPLLGQQGTVPTYLKSLTEEQRVAVRERVRAGLPFALDGSIPLVARAWAVRGRR